MSREIPKAAKERAARLWLQGESYRRICSETGMSLGALSDHINELRKKTPDLDQLRELNMLLRRDESTVFDAMRGGRLLDKVGQLGVSLDELEGFVKLSARISSERGVEAERFVGSSMRLMDWEAKTGKSYEEVVKDLEERTKQVEVLEAKAKDVQGQIQGLMERKAQLESEIRDAEGNLNLTLQKLNQAINTQERLQKLGLERVSHLAQFIEDFELLRFDDNMVGKLADWRKSLAEMGIDPDGLGEFMREKGSLEAQISKMRKEAEAEGKRVEALRTEAKRLWDTRTRLQAEASKLSRLRNILEKRKVMIPCKLCGREGVFMDVPSRTVAEDAMARGLVGNLRCALCGQSAQYSPWEILSSLGWLVLPE